MELLNFESDPIGAGTRSTSHWFVIFQNTGRHLDYGGSSGCKESIARATCHTVSSTDEPIQCHERLGSMSISTVVKRLESKDSVFCTIRHRISLRVYPRIIGSP